MTDWSDDEVLRRITRAYSREDDPYLTCTPCGDVAKQHSFRDGNKVKRELRCTNCSHMERSTVIRTTKTGVEVNALPFECNLSGLSATGAKLAVFVLWYDRSQEVAQCQ